MDKRGANEMGVSKRSVLIYSILALAALGLVTQLFGNTKGFLMNIFVMLLIAVAVFMFVYFVFMKKSPATNSEMKKYRKAVKQSKMKYKNANTMQIKSNQSKLQSRSKPKKRIGKRVTHLRVIEGKKNRGKEKDQATF